MATNATQDGSSYTARVNLMNRLGPFAGGVTDAPLASAFSARPRLVAGGAPQTYDIDTLPGTESMSVNIDGSRSIDEDVDLYLFDWTGGNCVLHSLSTGDGAQESLTVFNPATGRWKVLIDAVITRPGGLLVEYFDIFTNPSYGMVKTNGAATLRTVGQRWTESVGIRVGASEPASGRYLAGIVEVTSSESSIRLLPPPDQTSGLESPAPRRPVPLLTAIIVLERQKRIRLGH